MKFVIDDAIPFIRGVLEPYAEVVYKNGLLVNPLDVKDADALIIRTRTTCDASLLEGSKVRCIASASVGMDHVDNVYCSRHGIFTQATSGCNATAVMDYVISAVYGTAARRGIDIKNHTFGIIGAGYTGSAVEAAARRLGFNVLICDPPRQSQEGSRQFVNLDFLLENADIVSLHVPLLDSTRGMVNADFLSKMKVGAFLINASRGELMVEEDLLRVIPKLGPVVLDTWNHEPMVNTGLVDAVDIATPHVAGYSFVAKQKSTSIAVRAVARYFGLSDLYEFFPPVDIERQRSTVLDFAGKTQGEMAAVFQYNYPIFTDDFIFRSNPARFDEIRANYQYRKEFFIE